MSIKVLIDAFLDDDLNSCQKLFEHVESIDAHQIIAIQNSDEDGEPHDELMLFVHRPHGTIVMFSARGSYDRHILVRTSGPKTKTVTTWDGGDDWTVPISYFSSDRVVKTQIRRFFASEKLTFAGNWKILGLDE